MQCSGWSVDIIKQVIGLYKERVKTIKALAQEVVLVHNGASERDAEDMQKWITDVTASHLEALINVCEKQELFTHDECALRIKELATLLGVKLVTLLQPVRLALIGKASGPGVFDLLVVIGKRESIARLRALRATL